MSNWQENCTPKQIKVDHLIQVIHFCFWPPPVLPTSRKEVGPYLSIPLNFVFPRAALLNNTSSVNPRRCCGVTAMRA
jgi:hypothetical protein